MSRDDEHVEVIALKGAVGYLLVREWNDALISRPSNGDRRVGGKIGRSLIDRPPDRVQLLFQVFLKQTDVRAVNEQVGTHLQESRLLLNLSPEQGWSRGFQEPGRFRC